VSSLPETPISNTLAEHYPPPHDPRRQKYEERPALSKSQQHRPVVQKMIEEEQARELSESGVLGGKVTQLLLAAMLRRTNPQERMQQKTAGHPANKYWNLLHFVSMTWLGICAVYYEWLAHGVSGVSSLAKRDRSYYDAIHFVSFSQQHNPLFFFFDSQAVSFSLCFGILSCFNSLCCVVEGFINL
jgi:hypothetical protein